VTLLSWSYDDRARTQGVEIHVLNPTGELDPTREMHAGMYVNVTIRAMVPNAMTLPAEAVLDNVLDEGAKHYCFMAVDGKAVRLQVKVGVRGVVKDGDRFIPVVQVLQKQTKPEMAGEEAVWGEFTGTEQIVVSNPGALVDGQAVEVEKSPTK
jgi:hypothetical protein